jgi:S1-C subfamily serine protease
MLPAWMLAALLLTSGVSSGQTAGVLRVTITLPDATQAPVPIVRHGLLISDNPPTREPRRVVTGADGTVAINLAPGSYIVESDRPVAFLGQAYQWTTFVDVVAGRDTALALTAKNAEVLSTAATGPDATAVPVSDPASRLTKWQSSVVTIWSPTSRASGFVVDERGLVATDRNSVGRATTVEVQVSSTMKVPARVLVADPTRDVAIIWVEPSMIARATPLPIVCPPASASKLANGNEIETITPSLQGTGDLVRGEITGFHPRGIETDLRLSFGGTGGPVFTAGDETVVGLTSIRADNNASRSGDVLIVRAGIICEAITAARSSISGAEPPEPTPLPVEPARPYPANAATTSTSATSGATTPPVASSSNFDIAFITPGIVLRARERADRTGGRSARPPEAEARLGRLTDFGSWADYFADLPPVLIVRVTPKMVEGLWMRVAREAARTQGAALPAFKDFKTNFLRLRASCGGAEVTPIHPFVLEHTLDEKRVVREGLYVFDPEAFGPHCGGVTLTLSTEQAPEKADTLTIDSKVIEQIWRDFAPYRAAGR